MRTWGITKGAYLTAISLGGFTTGLVGFEGGVNGGDDNWELTDGNADELGGGNVVPDDSEGSGILVTVMARGEFRLKNRTPNHQPHTHPL